MFSFLSSTLTKGLAVAVVLLMASTAFFAWRSYSLTGDVAKARAELGVAVSANKDLKNSLEKQETSCLINDQITTEFFTEKDVISESAKKDIDAINATPSIPKKTRVDSPTQSAVQVNEASKQVVDLDSALPPDVVGLLQSSCDRAKGSPCNNPQ